ncbi:hypothetical protein [Brevibacillus agri]|uniref:hypothetical protein n=1 Tax=Brevibacillus agri TaxID=51101 RepID=UPI00046FEA32|nr:hypothetical protein [Brevibacillus agri]
MEIVMHEGETYKKVARHAEKGDRFVVYNGYSGYLTVGKVYTIDHFDGEGDPQVIDDEGDEYDLHDHHEYLVLEPVADESIVLVSVTPPLEKSYTIVVKDSALAVIERALAEANPFDKDAIKIRGFIEKVRKGA